MNRVASGQRVEPSGHTCCPQAEAAGWPHYVPPGPPPAWQLALLIGKGTGVSLVTANGLNMKIAVDTVYWTFPVSSARPVLSDCRHYLAENKRERGKKSLERSRLWFSHFVDEEICRPISVSNACAPNHYTS